MFFMTMRTIGAITRRPLVAALAVSAWLGASACQREVPPRAPLSDAGEAVAVLMEPPDTDAYTTINDLVAVAEGANREEATRFATYSLRNQAATLEAGLIFVQRIDAEVN